MLALWICWYISMGLMTCVVSKIYRLAVTHVPLKPYMSDIELGILALLVWPLVLLVGVFNLHKKREV